LDTGFSAESIVFSSENALMHFNTLYPKAKSKTFVLNFAVSHPEFRNISLTALLDKYRIIRPYFFCPNQVWAHKNHITVLHAVKKLKEQKKEILVVFSGKEFDARNPELFFQLKKFITDNDLKNNILFLGFIDRAEQLQLMNNAIAVIQPSLFEGWSTVLEDAKAMGQNVIVSDLPIHREQITENAVFFDPHNEKILADYMNESSITFKKDAFKHNYELNVLKFGKQFISIVKQLKYSNL
jgi:glycosyltransferase involved in cell wall biosynthesis